VGGMENPAIQKINDYIDEFFPMGKGEVIRDPGEIILFFRDIYISRRSLKHIVEQRSINDGLGSCEIKLLIRRLGEVLLDPEIVIKSNSEKYRDSSTYGRFNPGENQAVMAIIDYADKNKKYLITAFYKEEKQFLKLLKKKNP
jgi:hypothetical protein